MPVLARHKGWRIAFCTCAPLPAALLPRTHSSTYPTFHDAALALHRQLAAMGAPQACAHAAGDGLPPQQPENLQRRSSGGGAASTCADAARPCVSPVPPGHSRTSGVHFLVDLGVWC